MLNKERQKNRGDTIVEALFALAIAAFAVGITYATANHSLQQAITARERNQALNIIENQITDLRLRFQMDKVNFSSRFGNAPNHFCLDDSAITVSAIQPWIPYQNNSSGTEPTILQGNNAPYNNNCYRIIDGTTYYIDIVNTYVVSSPAPSVNPIVFQLFVRWDRVGGGQINQASLFYRPNGSG